MLFVKQKRELISDNFSLGFTLIEILVVCSIIAILATVVFISYSQSQLKSRDSRRKSDLEAISQAVNLFKNENGFYPPGAAVGTTLIYAPWNGLISSSTLTTSLNAYLSSLPNDPKTSFPNYYYMTNYTDVTHTTTKYRIYSILENTKDSQYKRCSISGSSYYYSVPIQDYTADAVCF